MKRTGIFFTYFQGERLRDFPQALAGILAQENVFYYDAVYEEYLRRVRQEFVPRAVTFAPEYIFWEFGYDATQGEYGDKGLTKDCHPRLAKVIKETADRVSQGRLITTPCGGSSRAVATYTIPRIINHQAELDFHRTT